METVVANANLLDHYGFVDSNGMAVLKEVAGKKKGYKSSTIVSPNGGVSNVFNGAQSNVTFLLPIGIGNNLDICHKMVLELDIENLDAVNAATLITGQYLIDYVDTLVGQQIESSWAENQMALRLYTVDGDEQLEQYASIEQYDYTYANGYATSAATIAASSSKKIYLQMFTPVDRGQLFLKAINQQISLQVYFRASCLTSTSASTTVQVNNIRLFMQGYSYEPSIQQSLLQRFRQKKHVYPFYASKRDIISNVAVSAASELSYQLSGFSGYKLPCLILGIRPANASQEGLYDFDVFGTLDHRINGISTYSTKQNLQEFTQMVADDIRVSVPGSGTNLLLAPHSDNVYGTLKKNKNCGTMLYNPNVNLLIQTASVTGNRDIVAITFVAGVLVVENGALSFQQF